MNKRYENYEENWQSYAIDPDEEVTFNGENMKIKDVPDPVVRADWGYGHYPSHIKNRQIHPEIIPGGWKYDPSSCLVASEPRGIIVGDSVVCPGCGLDGT